MEAFSKSLSQNQRGNYRRQVNLLARERGAFVDVVTAEPDLSAEFQRFERAHQLQWKAEGKLGHFGDWPRASVFHRALVKAQSGLGRVRLVRLLAGGEVAAYEYAYSFAGRFHWLLPARAVGNAWHRYGLGRQSLISLFQTAIAEGVRIVDAGPGHYEYKQQLGCTETMSHTLLVITHKALLRKRFAAFSKCSELLHLAYYRIWFGRIAPRLPLPRGPLWPIWIRSRL
jgi:CelD/BcsL family acetyltransferase involved in cellulose biosynthesis